MAGRKENLKTLFTNTRSRVIIVFTAMVLFISLAIGVGRFYISSQSQNSKSTITTAPAIQSIPGALNPTPEYSKLQEYQNINQAKVAYKEAKSFIPTIIRSQEFNGNMQSLGKTVAQGVGFSALARENEEGLQKGFWLQQVKDSNCAEATLEKVLQEGGKLSAFKGVCGCEKLKQYGYSLNKLTTVCSCKDLKKLGVTARELKDIGFSATQLRICGFSACAMKAAGFSAQQLKDAGFSDDELRGAGFPEEEIAKASGLPDGLTASDVRKAGCREEALVKLRAASVSAGAIRRINGCSAAALKAAGYTAADLEKAGFTLGELRKAGFTAQELKDAGAGALTKSPLLPAAFPKDCDKASLEAARKASISAKEIRKNLGCSAAALRDAGYDAKELRDAGFTAAELKNAGFSAQELKDAGFTARELKDVGFSAKELKDVGFGARALQAAGFNASQLKALGYTAQALKDVGFTAKDLQQAGFSANSLKEAGFSAEEIKNAGYNSQELSAAGLSSTENAPLLGKERPTPTPTLSNPLRAQTGETAAKLSAAQRERENAKRMQEILKRQQERMNEQKYKQAIQQEVSQMQSVANGAIQSWSHVATQAYIGGVEKIAPKESSAAPYKVQEVAGRAKDTAEQAPNQSAASYIKTGDIFFGVLDTAVNSDEPGPILATVVSGKLTGAKLIGSLTLPPNADKMVISFNTLSISSVPQTVSIHAYAIDPNTGRTALSSYTDHHYLSRYGALFASGFLEGFGNALQSSGTSVTVGNNVGGGSFTLQTASRSTLQNAVIGLATVGRNWGQAVQQEFNRPTTVAVCSGTPIGILFTQDLKNL